MRLILNRRTGAAKFSTVMSWIDRAFVRMSHGYYVKCSELHVRRSFVRVGRGYPARTKGGWVLASLILNFASEKLPPSIHTIDKKFLGLNVAL